MTEERLQELCHEWQKVLRLQDWDVVVKVVRGYYLGDKEGTCSYTQSIKAATVRILDPKDYMNEDFPLSGLFLFSRGAS